MHNDWLVAELAVTASLDGSPNSAFLILNSALVQWVDFK